MISKIASVQVLAEYDFTLNMLTRLAGVEQKYKKDFPTLMQEYISMAKELLSKKRNLPMAAQQIGAFINKATNAINSHAAGHGEVLHDDLRSELINLLKNFGTPMPTQE